MKVYVSGKITGDKDYKKKFGIIARRLENLGYAVFNPAILPDGFEYEDYMKIDLCALSTCDIIFLIDDWMDSPGAIREVKEAERLGLKIITERNLIEEEKEIA